jgi:transposase InsO family protein
VLWERSVTEQRYNAVLEVLEAGLPVVEVADRYGVSRQSVHTWIARYRAGGLEGLADRSHRPNRCPHQLPAAVEARVCELRRAHPSWGPQRLRHELERRRVEPVPSRMAIYRVLVRNQLITPQRRRRRTWRRFERERPMQLWQLDLIELPLADGTEIKVLTGVDDHSRYCVSAQAMTRATGRAVCRGLAVALGRYGVPEEVLTDNGKQFTGRFGKPRPAEVLFERILRENGITHRLTRVRAPTTTGKVERFHQTLGKELLATLPPLPSAEVAQQVLDAWVEDYNQRRPHQALGGQTPAERFLAKPDPAHLDQAAGTMLPLWLPAALGEERVGMPAATPVEVPRPPAVEANPAGTNPTVLPLEVDATVPACGNLGVAGRQVWLGRRLAGRTVQVRLDGATMHVSLDGRLLKTLPCRLRPELLGRGRLAGARPAGPPPTPVAVHPVLVGPGDAVEADRRVNAAGTIGVAGQQISVGLPLAGQTVTLRLEAATMHVLADGALVRSLPSPVPAGSRARLQGARLARGALVIPQGRWWSAEGHPSAASSRSLVSGSRSGSPTPAKW